MAAKPEKSIFVLSMKTDFFREVSFLPLGRNWIPGNCASRERNATTAEKVSSLNLNLKVLKFFFFEVKRTDLLD